MPNPIGRKKTSTGSQRPIDLFFRKKQPTIPRLTNPYRNQHPRSRASASRPPVQVNSPPSTPPPPPNLSVYHIHLHLDDNPPIIRTPHRETFSLRPQLTPVYDTPPLAIPNSAVNSNLLAPVAHYTTPPFTPPSDRKSVV